MFVSKIEAKKDSIALTKGLSNADILHKCIMNLFPDGVKGNPRSKMKVLFYFKVTKNEYRIIVQSDVKPDFSRVRWIKNAECYNYEKENLPLNDNDICYFHLKTIPYRSVDGKRKSITDEVEKMQWMINRLEKSGCKVLKISLKNDTLNMYLNRGGKDVTLVPTLFDTIIRVEDKNKFWEQCVSGIGKQKSYGLGLPILSKC